MSFRNIPLHSMELDNKDNQKLLHAMDHYVSKLKSLLPEVAEKFQITQKDGNILPWDITSIESGSTLSIPNSTSFISFLRKIEQHHDLAVPAAFISSEPTTENTQSNQISESIEDIINDKDRDNKIDSLKTNSSEEMVEILEIVREKALSMAREQAELMSKVSKLTTEYQQTGDESKLKEILSINHELLELRSEQEGLITLSDALVEHIQNEPNIQNSIVISQAEFTTDAIESNTLTKQPIEKFITNVDYLRKEFDVAQGSENDMLQKKGDEGSLSVAHQPVKENALNVKHEKSINNEPDFNF